MHWYMDVSFADDQMQARSDYAAHNLALLKHITLNLIRLDPIPRKGDSHLRYPTPPRLRVTPVFSRGDAE